MWLLRRRRKPEVRLPYPSRTLPSSSTVAQGGSTDLGRVRLALAQLAESLGDLTLPSDPQFLWVTEFPLFTRADADKEFLAHGRWSSSHHPFTAPMWQDVEKMYAGDIEAVSRSTVRCLSWVLMGLRACRCADSTTILSSMVLRSVAAPCVYTTLLCKSMSSRRSWRYANPVGTRSCF